MSRYLMLCVMLLALVAATPRGYAQDLDLGDDGGAMDLLDEGLDMGLEEGPATVDLSGLAQSCYLPLAYWHHVKPEPKRRQKAPEGEWHWKVDGDSAAPLDTKPITTRIQVPADGTYRVFLRQTFQLRDPAPVAFAIKPVTGDAVGESIRDYTFGSKALDSTMTGKEHERKRPLVFESEPALLGMIARPTAAWEFIDVELKAGVYELSLSAANTRALVTGLLLTQAKGFRPSMDAFEEYNTVQRIYFRYRVRDAQGADRHSVGSSLTYHWRGRTAPGKTQPLWGWQIGDVPEVATGEWTDFIDATEAVVPGPGPWSTCNIGLPGIRSGMLEMELAWRPDPAAVMYHMETRAAAGRARVRVAHGSGVGVDGRKTPAWGVWRQGHLEAFVPEAEVVENYFTWATAAMEKLNLPADHPMPKKIIFNTSARTTPAYIDRAGEMLAVLGVNWVHGASKELIDKYDLVDGIWLANSPDFERAAKAHADQADKVIRVKIGDEISTFIDSDVINNSPQLLEGFRDHLRARAKAAGVDLLTYMGTDDLSQIVSNTELPPRPGIFERRLYYESNVYAHLASVPGYRHVTQGYLKHFPNAEISNNYSPHPLFLTGTTMNHSDWFVLCRNEAQTLAWGEDWATGGSWGLGTTYQCTSYYAALVAAAARRHDYPSGFYVGSNCGGSALKIFSCVAQGITRVHLYDWGPIDGLAEGSNAWSERQPEYYSIGLATHALGPADTIIVDGQRQQSRVAILYNRSHEIWQVGAGRMNHDWMWTYIAANGASEPVDVVTEDDLIGHIGDYDVLVIGGFNLGLPELAAVRAWVEAGGTLILTSGGAMLDLNNDENTATASLAGARQRPLRGETPDKATVTFTANAVTPAATFVANYRMASLEATEGTVVATWEDGTAAAVLHSVGDGQVLTLGFLPGRSFAEAGQSAGAIQPWITGTLRQVLGEPVARLNVPGAETTAFSHASGMAVLVNLYHPPKDVETLELSVLADREVTSVRSALKGDLPFTKEGDRIVIQLPAPQPVDTVILR